MTRAVNRNVARRDPRGSRSARLKPAAVVVLALVLAVIGVVMASTSGAGASENAATVGGLTARLSTAGWVNVDHQMMPGYQMPAQMMPGVPAEGDARLAVPMTLVNSGRNVEIYAMEDEFRLVGGADQDPRVPESDSFGGGGRLAPGSAVDGILYFDTKTPEPQDSPLFLEWTRDDHTVRIRLPFSPGSVPPSQHH